MKLKLPGDLTGGLLIFGLLFAIALIEFHVLKKAYRSKVSGGSDQQRCNAAGGDWHPNEDTDDPCCLLPKGADADVPECQGNLGPNSYFPEVCANEPSSAICKGYQMKA